MVEINICENETFGIPPGITKNQIYNPGNVKTCRKMSCFVLIENVFILHIKRIGLTINACLFLFVYEHIFYQKSESNQKTKRGYLNLVGALGGSYSSFLKNGEKPEIFAGNYRFAVNFNFVPLFLFSWKIKMLLHLFKPKLFAQLPTAVLVVYIL